MLESFLKNLSCLIDEDEAARMSEEIETLTTDGLPEAQARQAATLRYLGEFLPTVALVDHTGSDFYSASRTMEEVRKYLELGDIASELGQVVLRDRWDRMAFEMLNRSLKEVVYRLSLACLEEADGNIEAYFGRHRGRVKLFKGLWQDLRGSSPTNLHPFEVIIRSLEALTPEES